MNGKTRNETRSETALDDVSRVRTNSGRQFGSLTRRSHQLIAHHQSPRLSSRFVVPPGSPFLVSRSVRLPVPSPQLGLPFLGSSRPVVRFAFRFSIVLPLRLVSFMAADWQRRE